MFGSKAGQSFVSEDAPSVAAAVKVRRQVSSANDDLAQPSPYEFAYMAESDEGSHGHSEKFDGVSRVEGNYFLKVRHFLCHSICTLVSSHKEREIRRLNCWLPFHGNMLNQNNCIGPLNGYSSSGNLRIHPNIQLIQINDDIIV